MIQRCFFYLGMSSFFFGCTSKEIEDIPNTLPIHLDIVDSTIVNEESFFLNGQLEVKLFNDSILAVSSMKTPAIGFFDLKGKEIGNIASKDFPEAPFIPSSFELVEYPKIVLLDRRKVSVRSTPY